MPPDSLPLDLWLLRLATMVALLAERRWLRPWRGRLLDVAREIQRRAIEARLMQSALDRMTEEARIAEAAGDAQAELVAVVERWRRGDV